MRRTSVGSGRETGWRGRLRAARIAGVVGMVAWAVGCSSVEVYRLTEETFQPKPKDQEIKLFLNKVQRPHREIAYIDSQPLPDTTEASRDTQLRQIQETARKLGADAVHDIRPLTERVQGLVVDQRVPVQAYKQGKYKLHFLRGTAIVYLDTPTAPGATPTPGTTSPSTSSPGTTPTPTPEPTPAPGTSDSSSPTDRRVSASKDLPEPKRVSQGVTFRMKRVL